MRRGGRDELPESWCEGGRARTVPRALGGDYNAVYARWRTGRGRAAPEHAALHRRAARRRGVLHGEHGGVLGADDGGTAAVSRNRRGGGAGEVPHDRADGPPR